MIKNVMLFLALCGLMSSQSDINLDATKSKMVISGTSSLHDWEMVVEEFDATGTFSETQIQDLVVTVKSKSMKSGKTIMDNKAYDAVQAKSYPDIVYNASSLRVNDAQISGSGVLEIAGKSRPVDLFVNVLSDDDRGMQLQGEIPLQMSDFDIQPPTALFGTLTTGDSVVIKYEIFLIK